MRQGADGGDETGTKRQREAQRSREAILAAAERLFAEKGYESTSLKEIAEAAGFSRNTPAYFFGSKEGLYRAVLDRVLADAGALVEQAQANFPVAGTQENEQPGNPPEEAFTRAQAEILGSYIDFLASRPSYVKLVEREALGRQDTGLGESSEAPRASSGSESSFPPVISMLGASGVEVLERVMEGGFLRETAPRYLSASMIALCSYPFMLGGGLVRTLGIEPDDPAFVEEWKHHVTSLLTHGIFANDPGDPEPAARPSSLEEGSLEEGSLEEGSLENPASEETGHREQNQPQERAED